MGEPRHFNQIQFYQDKEITVNTLSFEDLMKLAAKSPKARNTLLSMVKTANGKSTEFNENVPGMTEDESAYADGNGQAPPEQGAPPPKNPTAIPANAPAEAQAPEGPEAVGARAAQSFIGPEVMQAAMSGDPAAADLIARIAGQVAGAVSETALKAAGNASQMGTAGVPAEGGVPGEGVVGPGAQAVPAAPSTPEQDLANEIVPPAQAAPVPAAAPPAGQTQAGPGQEQGNMDQGKAGQTQALPTESAGPVPAKGAESKAGGEKIDVQTVAKLIQAAKAGKI
jgi:hypothetical protein